MLYKHNGISELTIVPYFTCNHDAPKMEMEGEGRIDWYSQYPNCLPTIGISNRRQQAPIMALTVSPVSLAGPWLLVE
jgi:hypothetical protein